ncbi:MAG: FMN-binding protein [Methylophaga sp.]|nr:FMN-binding protein [Methylophaga sp.]
MTNSVNRQGLVSLLTALLLFVVTTNVSARGVYQTNEAFLNEVYDQTVPKSDVIWLKGEVREQVKKILGHNYNGLRIRYWKQNNRSTWILEEIGKEEPITFGIVINGDSVEKVKVLAYRESRGWEVKHPAFTQQFNDAKLKNQALDRNIDGITGATLSVRAMTAVVTLALYLDDFVSTLS